MSPRFYLLINAIIHYFNNKFLNNEKDILENNTVRGQNENPRKRSTFQQTSNLICKHLHKTTQDLHTTACNHGDTKKVVKVEARNPLHNISVGCETVWEIKHSS